MRSTPFRSGFACGATRISVAQPLAAHSTESLNRPLTVADAERHAVVVTEVELREVARKVRLADVVVDAVDAALEDREVVLGCVGVGVTANVLAVAVIA